MNFVQILASRAMVVENMVDKDIMTRALRYLIQHQILTSKGLKDDKISEGV